MKKALLSFLLILFYLNLKAQLTGPEAAFLPDSSELYFKVSGGRPAQLDLMLKDPVNKNFLEKFTATFGSFYDDQKQYEILLVSNVDEWEMSLFEARNAQTDLLRKSKGQISNELYTFLEKEIRFNYWHMLFAYPILRSNQDIKQTRVTSLPQVMVKNFRFEELKNDGFLVSRNFRKLLTFAVTYFNSSERGFAKYSDIVESTINKTDYALKKLSGAPLDYYLSSLLISGQHQISSSSARYIISQIEGDDFRAFFKGDFLSEIQKRELATSKKANEKSNDPSVSAGYPRLTDLSSKTFDFSKYKGKVIYVDFWASWCGPCRKEFPFSKEMHESLSDKEKKNIVFLYISIDDDPGAWKSAVKSLGLDQFENGYSEGGWESQVVRKYNISGIPRYMIIDKSGAVVKSDAGRPSNPSTRQELIDLAK